MPLSQDQVFFAEYVFTIRTCIFLDNHDFRNLTIDNFIAEAGEHILMRCCRLIAKP